VPVRPLRPKSTTLPAADLALEAGAELAAAAELGAALALGAAELEAAAAAEDEIDLAADVAEAELEVKAPIADALRDEVAPVEATVLVTEPEVTARPAQRACFSWTEAAWSEVEQLAARQAPAAFWKAELVQTQVTLV